jgi:hypothetical protein
MEKQIELVNNIIFNAIMHGADPGGSYDCNRDGLLNSIDQWMAHNHITGYLVKEVDIEYKGCTWLGIVQLVKEG